MYLFKFFDGFVDIYIYNNEYILVIINLISYGRLSYLFCISLMQDLSKSNLNYFCQGLHFSNKYW